MTRRFQTVRGADLKPRAIAALCSMRTGGHTAVSLRAAIGDPTVQETRDLLGDLAGLELVQRDGSSHWCLTYDGIGWLETNGLTATDEVKRVVGRLWTAATSRDGAKL